MFTSGVLRMDVLEIIDHLDEIEILFEPVYSADEHIIVAYEVIGQISNIDVVEFTYNESIPTDIRVEVEQFFISKAIEKSLDVLKDVNLYLPCNPNLLMEDFGESYFEIIKDLVDEELLSHIYLAISVRKYHGDFNQLQHPVRYIRTYGVKVMLDHIGPESNLDQILMIEPAVLKINVSQLNYNAWGAQSHVFATIQAFSVKIGATLMFDNIQTDYQLHHAWKNGARYFKGPYLQTPSSTFIPKDTLKNKFRNECKQFISTEMKQLEIKYDEMTKLQKAITTIVDYTKPSSQNIEQLLELAKKLETYAVRFYICNEEGFQTSPNIVKQNGVWNVRDKHIGKNWSWRPYFLFNIIKLRNGVKGELSAMYSDIQTGELTRTFSMAISEHEYLFVDISYDYLFEHNILN